MDGLIFDIAEGSIHDGPGLRTTVFLKGCPLRCRWCHSPEGQSPKPEWLNTAVGRRLCGVRWEAEALARYLKRTGELTPGEGGVTFSGGEPLIQADFLLEVLDRLGGLHTIVETSGMGDCGKLLALARQCSRIHFGLKILVPASARSWTGTDLRVILRNLRALDESGAAEYLFRIPLLAGIMDTGDHLRRLMNLTFSLRHLLRIEFLPANPLAPAKYAACGRTFPRDRRLTTTGTIPEWFAPAVPWKIWR